MRRFTPRGNSSWGHCTNSQIRPGSSRACRANPKDDTDALGYLIEHDRELAEKSGRAPLKIKSIRREGAKPPKIMKVK